MMLRLGRPLFAASSSSWRFLSSTPSLPIIALDAADRMTTAQQLAAAFRDYGCCYLTGHRITSALESKTMAAAQSFCALPEDVKASIPVIQNGKGFTRGYIGIGKESGSAERIEVKEAFSYGYEWETKSKQSWDNGLQGPNVWPLSSTWSAAHRATMNEFFRAMVTASRSVSRALGQSLFEDADALDQYCEHGDTISIMRLFHYFPYDRLGQEMAKGLECIGSSPHTDWGFLTLILQDPVGGLQFRYRDEWIDVPYIPGTLVANAGDYLSLVTQGRCVSPVHRVVADDRERYSMVFFYYPDFDAQIPIVPEQRVRIGGDHGNQHAFNNLLDGTVQNPNACFGEYIMAKWANVQR